MKKIHNILLLWASFFLVSNIFALQNQEEYLILDDLALKTKADKGSNYHNYTEIYAQYFSSLRDQPIKFLEIGIWKGYSVKLWEEYFKNAELHFIDITFQNVEYFSERSKYHLANQESPKDLQNFIQETGGEFDIIVDDGGHTMGQQIVSFCTLFPHVKSGGMYIIEDLHTSYWRSFGGDRPTGTTIAFLKSLIDEVNFVGARSGRASHLNVEPALQKEMNIFRETIQSIHFYDSVAVIIKR
jgi:hypothetical protein